MTQHTKSFKPAWWLKSGHLQTLFPTLLRKRPQLKTKRERVELEDGDFIDIDWYNNTQNQQFSPIVIIMHGLAGSSKSSYMLGMLQALSAQGFHCVAMNFRGCSGEQNRLARAYHSGDTGDIESIFQHIKSNYPNTDIYVMGFSLGANVLLKWLGEQKTNSTVKAAIAISAPMVLNECANKLDKGFSKVYRAYLMRPLKQFVLQKKHHLTQLKNLNEAQKITALGDLKDVKSFWQYDDQVVASLHGFDDAHDYYRQSSSRQFIPHITVPTLIIHAKDDPFMTPQVIPLADEIPANVTLETSASGGHVGFVSGANPFKPVYWLEQRVVAFITTHENLKH